MNRKTQNNKRLKKASLLLIIVTLSFFPAFLTNLSTLDNQSEILSEDNNIENFNIKNLKSSTLALGNDTWWDTSFGYRKLLKTTNTHNYNFTDYGISVSFDYTELAGKIQSNLDDIRIVENGIERKYYVVKDYPSLGLATVYFDTNISKSTTEYDTYMYFNKTIGSNEASGTLDSFGWVKNGDFELDESTAQYFDPYGWTFSHDQVDQIKDVSNAREASNFSVDSYGFFENSLTHIDDVEMAERVESGNYAYKWGGEGTFLPQVACRDYVGTFYSYPFKVPIIDGGAGEISLNVYRNVRTWFFEDEEATSGISEDGYFLRICNGSDSKYTAEVDLHENIGSDYDNWVETYGGYAFISPNKKTLLYHTELKEHFEIGPSMYTRSDTSSDGDLTGSLEINLTDYMGEEIFIEFGMWGPEDGDTQTQKSGFFQVDDVRFNYTISAEAQQLQAQISFVDVIVKDVDGRIIPTADVWIVDNSYAKESPDYYVANGTTTNGRITFNNIPNGYYNITANYTRGSNEIEIFNSIDSGTGPYYFNGISYTHDLCTNIWTIDFEIVDGDGIPLKYGYVEVNYSLGGNLVDSLTLDVNGKATFRWLNRSSYYYKCYYDNDDYGSNFSPKALDESFVYRSDYIQDNVKFRHHTVNVIEEESYSISERFYTNGSRTVLGNKKIIKANITLQNMYDYIDEISIYYIDIEDLEDIPAGNLIYYKDYPTTNVTADFIELDISLLNNDNLEDDNYEVYGLLVEVNGYNASQSNGIINVDLVETCNVYTETPIARMNIRLTYFSDIDQEYKPLSGTINVIDNATGLHLVNLSAFSSRDGYTYTPKNSYETPFWYLTGRVYNFSIDVPDNPNVDFNITYINPLQWIPAPGEKINEYNYTLYQNSSITFNVIPETFINFTQYDTAFNESYGTSEALWGENMNFWVEFQSTDDNWVTSDYISKPPGSCILTIKLAGTQEILRTVEMDYISNGNYTATINTGLISAGNDKEYYDIEINGYHPIYDNPTPVGYLVKILAKPTTISAHDYDSLAVIPSKTYSAYYDELINITVRYSETDFGTPLPNALLSYEWIGLSPISFFSDPLNSDYYTFTINTEDAQSAGLKIISITASLENYTRQSDYLIYLNVLERKTSLNNDIADIIYMRPPDVWVEDTKIFRFTYRDEKTEQILGDLSIATFIWEELYDNGTKIEGIYGSGDLAELSNKTYILDFNTGVKTVGNYFLFVTIKKDNYEEKNVMVNLKIVLREFSETVLINSQLLEDDSQISVNQGAEINFYISLTDDSRNYIALEGATVEIYFGHTGDTLPLTPSLTEPGVYEIEFGTGNIDTFIAAKTFVAILYIRADNFTSAERTFIITVKMDEIFPGMPTFYFILITASIIGVVGSIVGYRVIQQARIPKHVKKIRKLKGLIKSKKKITEIPTIPTKEHMMAKLFGNDWKEIGLSLDEALGIQDLKTKKLPLKDKISKEGGDQ